MTKSNSATFTLASGLVLAIGMLATSAAAAADKPVESAVPSFRHGVMAVLSKAGCNQGTCHGKGRLKLSLRGQSPPLDFQTLTRQGGSRRADVVRPETSLLL
ncbi:MAG: hypothetical protein ACKVHE_26180 [Planctomycetales bacterium]|jgi:hypothetical protein